jgi:hypothetical protein
MENQKSNAGLKAGIAILAVSLLGSIGYNIKQSQDVATKQIAFVSATNEKSAVLNDLTALKLKYDSAIAENTSMSDELIVERDKVVKLMDEVKRAKGTIVNVDRYKQRYLDLETKMNSLIAENDGLTKMNSSLMVQRDSTITVLNNNKIEKENLVVQNTELAKTVEVGSKLTVSNLKASAYKIRSSGKQIVTDKASRADALKIDFTIAENKIAKTGDKDYYVQVIDANNNVIGEKKVANFEDKELNYSFISNVKYENKAVDVSELLPGKDFAKGNYFVNVFDKNELVSNSSFVLR